MKVVLFLAVALTLSACGDDPLDGSVNSGFSDQITNSGNSFVLLNCSDASEAISSNQSQPNIFQQKVELGMTAAEIRSLVGKPRHIIDSIWTFGHDQPINFVGGNPFDLLPTTTVTALIGTTAFSGDNTNCNNTELSFINAANNLIRNPDTMSHRHEIPECRDAAIRIAARVELGMTPNEVRDIVGRPVEITPNGLYRYKYGQPSLGDGPIVQFGDRGFIGDTSSLGNQFFGDTEETGISAVVVTAYWTPELQC